MIWQASCLSASSDCPFKLPVELSSGAPLKMGQKKCFGHFFTKISMQRFLPLRPPAVPSEGRLCPAPRGPPPGGVPPKKGVAPPRAKNREKSAILGAQYAKNGHFGAKNGHFWANFDHFWQIFKTERGAMQGKKRSSAAPVRCAKTRQFIQY